MKKHESNKRQIHPVVGIAASQKEIKSLSPWAKSARAQIDQAHRLWPDVRFPEPPHQFVRHNKREVLLLHVPQFTEVLWGVVMNSKRYKSYPLDAFVPEGCSLLPHPAAQTYSEPVWLAFNPVHALGVSPANLEGNRTLAGPEIFSALIQFPDWPQYWVDDNLAAVNLAGFQLVKGSMDRFIPRLYLLEDGKTLSVGAGMSGMYTALSSSPTVRMC